MNERSTEKKDSVRVLAIVSVIFLICLYLATLLAAIFDHSAEKSIFRFLLFCSLVLPVLLYIFLMLSRLKK